MVSAKKPPKQHVSFVPPFDVVVCETCGHPASQRIHMARVFGRPQQLYASEPCQGKVHDVADRCMSMLAFLVSKAADKEFVPAIGMLESFGARRVETVDIGGVAVPTQTPAVPVPQVPEAVAPPPVPATVPTPQMVERYTGANMRPRGRPPTLAEGIECGAEPYKGTD